jgi:hypothetical protein
MKARAKDLTVSNIKPMSGGAAITTLTAGQYVFGDLSTQGTDIINFSHFYTASGVRIELGKPCKVYIGTNLILTNETEPTTPPDPEPSNGAIVKAVIYFEDGTTQELFP